MPLPSTQSHKKSHFCWATWAFILKKWDLQRFQDSSYLIIRSFADKCWLESRSVAICTFFIIQVQEDQCERLITHILHVLSECSREVIRNLIQNEKDKILNIGKYIGFHFPGMGDRLYEAIIEISNPHRDFNTSIWLLIFHLFYFFFRFWLILVSTNIFSLKLSYKIRLKSWNKSRGKDLEKVLSKNHHELYTSTSSMSMGSPLLTNIKCAPISSIMFW